MKLNKENQAASPKKEPRKKKSGAKRRIWMALLSLILVALTTGSICVTAFAFYIKNYISQDVDIYLDAYRLNETSHLYYVDKETGEFKEFEALHGTEDREWADLDEIPKMLQLAFISVEDNSFYAHDGVNWKRTIGATLNYIVPFRSGFGGGSTITQQLIKNLTGDSETSVKRKIQEILRALELEKKYEKEDILEMYLNTIYFGQGAYGVKVAAETYFNKDMSELTIAECAALAGIVKNPYGYDLKRFPEKNKERKETVLLTMLEYGNITREEYDVAMAEDVQYVPHEEETSQYQSYFVDAVIDSVIADMQEQLGYSYENAKTLLYCGGLKIITTMDPDVQDCVDEVFGDESNFPGVLGSDGTYPEAAITIMDPYTGHVVALYGGRGEKDGNRVLNRATQSKRSPGSCIKPASVYAPALEYGLITPISVVDDAPKDFEVRASGWPWNENRKYSGRTTIYTGIAKSYNTVAVDLVQKLGLDRSFNFAYNNLGMTNLVLKKETELSDGRVDVKSDRDTSPLAMGSLTDGITVLELTAAYSAFVNDGQYTTPVLYTAVYDTNDQLIYENKAVTTIAMEQKTRDYMIQLLTGVVQNGTGTKAALTGIEVGGKTGTTSADNDRWFTGVTPYYTAAVWFGYDMPQSLGKFSVNPALNLWKQVMEKVHKNLPEAEFELKTEMTTVTYCRDSGKLANEWCEKDIRGSRLLTAELATEDVPTEVCDCHVGAEICGETGKLATGYCDPNHVEMVGLLSIKREYPYGQIEIGDQQYCLPYLVTTEGMFAAQNATFGICTVHNAQNNANHGTATPEPDPDEGTQPDEDSGGIGGWFNGLLGDLFG
ncbi:MAG: PBP1A family penicillin-binding protein [Clostridia bacterium]|nr:PBP1A family penicillin-binding protein [Clostridia bacterium]